MLPVRKSEMFVSRSCFPWGRCLIRKGPGMGLWGPIFSHLITMPSPLAGWIQGWAARIILLCGTWTDKSFVFFFLIRWSRLRLSRIRLSLNIPKPKAGRETDFPSGNSWAVWALVASFAWLLWNCTTPKPALGEGCSRGDICLSVIRAEKRSGLRHQRHRNSGVSFVLWACDDYNSTLKVKGVLSALTLVWALPEISTLLDMGFRDGTLWPWSLVTFVLSVSAEHLWLTKPCAKKARTIYLHYSSILCAFGECDFVQVLQLALEIEW